MSNYDLTEAIEAADIAIHQGADAPCHCADEDLTAALTAALPHLEQQIREQVAAEAWDEGAEAAWERSSPEVNGRNYYWRSDGEPVNPYIARTRKDTDHD